MAKSTILMIGATFLAAPAAAQVTSLETPNPMPKGTDLNRKVCERIITTGSRLGARTVCLTVEQWRDKRREHREETERAQKNVGIEVVR